MLFLDLAKGRFCISAVCVQDNQPRANEKTHLVIWVLDPMPCGRWWTDTLEPLIKLDRGPLGPWENGDYTQAEIQPELNALGVIGEAGETGPCRR